MRVLLVDDSASIRSLLFGSLSSIAKVKVCSSAAEALQQAGSETPDLVIADYRMPETNGMQLISQLRASFPQLAAVLMANSADVGALLSGSSGVVEEFIEKPFFLEEASLRIKRVLDRVSLSREAQLQQASEASLRGSLAQMSVIDLMQTLDIGRKSCRLRITGRSSTCQMHFVEGQLVHASLGSLTGEVVVQMVVAWNEGSFVVDFESENCPQTIHRSTQSLLLDALRRFDEEQRDAAEAVPKRPPESGRAGVPSQIPAQF